ncbi:hypothetical protein HYW44_03460 [Candidatus Daviesbacteria bacterium]|nr:hypothetical protein [Candidatus Daviesbacteria bacterium]
MKKFYSHLIEIESLTFELDQFELAYHEKHELAKLIDSNIHNVVMDTIFSKLSDKDKENFAKIVSSEDHKKIWDFLKSKTEDIEDEIKKAALDIKKKLHEDIKEAKKK